MTQPEKRHSIALESAKPMPLLVREHLRDTLETLGDPSSEHLVNAILGNCSNLLWLLVSTFCAFK